MTDFHTEHINHLVQEINTNLEVMDAFKYEGKSVGAFVGCIGSIGVSLATKQNEGILLLGAIGGAIAGTGVGHIAGVLRGVRAVRSRRNSQLNS